MSAKDLISKWEDALAQVLQIALPADEGRELSDEDLEQVSAVAGVALRSQLRAGDRPTPGADESGLFGCWV